MLSGNFPINGITVSKDAKPMNFFSPVHCWMPSGQEVDDFIGSAINLGFVFGEGPCAGHVRIADLS